MTEWSQAVWICVSILIGAFIVSISVYFVTIGQNINQEIARQEATRISMKEFRQLNGFNNKVVYAQDCVSLILQYRGSLPMRIMHGNDEYAYWCSDAEIEDVLKNSETLIDSMGGTATKWKCNGATTLYESTAVYEKFDLTKVYEGSITYGANGEVLGVTFTKGHMNSNNVFEAD